MEDQIYERDYSQQWEAAHEKLLCRENPLDKLLTGKYKDLFLLYTAYSQQAPKAIVPEEQ